MNKENRSDKRNVRKERKGWIEQGQYEIVRARNKREWDGEMTQKKMKVMDGINKEVEKGMHGWMKKSWGGTWKEIRNKMDGGSKKGKRIDKTDEKKEMF